ncbi:uncharacterized protein LOC131211347 [Anopheles bellator]|uniref:uncharacterized protein LOC131211347 n=1 Tax=Anopheles bellator TaxID=139047 RepID=UPI0026490056|nr:uncharacterized protein LOC131211347 [Anopheles bellator]
MCFVATANRAQEFLRPICEQVTELRKKRTVKIRAVLVGFKAQSLVEETVSHKSYYGCPKCIMKGTWIHNSISFTNGDEPEVNLSKYESPSRKHAEFMTSVYDNTHKVAEEPNMYPLQPLVIDINEDVLVGDDRHLLH